MPQVLHGAAGAAAAGAERGREKEGKQEKAHVQSLSITGPACGETNAGREGRRS